MIEFVGKAERGRGGTDVEIIDRPNACCARNAISTRPSVKATFTVTTRTARRARCAKGCIFGDVILAVNFAVRRPSGEAVRSRLQKRALTGLAHSSRADKARPNDEAALAPER